MSLRRDFRKFLRAATRALNAYAERRSATLPEPISKGDGGKGADALDKALGAFDRDPILAAVDRGAVPQSYARLLDEPASPPSAADPPPPND